jgi:hypothetical protein
MVDPANNISYLSGIFTVVTSTFFGIAAPAEPNWTLTSGFESTGGFRYTASSGSGTYSAKQTLNGSYVANGQTVNLALNYDPANALAVTQSSASAAARPTTPPWPCPTRCSATPSSPRPPAPPPRPPS